MNHAPIGEASMRLHVWRPALPQRAHTPRTQHAEAHAHATERGHACAAWTARGAPPPTFHSRSLYCDCLSPGLSSLSCGIILSSKPFQLAFMRLHAPGCEGAGVGGSEQLRPVTPAPPPARAHSAATHIPTGRPVAGQLAHSSHMAGCLPSATLPSAGCTAQAVERHTPASYLEGLPPGAEPTPPSNARASRAAAPAPARSRTQQQPAHFSGCLSSAAESTTPSAASASVTLRASTSPSLSRFALIWSTILA